MLTLSSLLSGCHFPSASPPGISPDRQRQTEIAGILNPDGLITAPPPGPTPLPGAGNPSPPAPPTPLENGFLLYHTQQGDTLPALAERFAVPAEAIQSGEGLSDHGYLPADRQLIIPAAGEAWLPLETPFFPDSEVVYGPTSGDFDSEAYIAGAGGFLNTYSETVKNTVLSGTQIVATVAIETSTNPRLLLAFLEYRSGWVRGFPAGAARDPYPIGFGAGADTGLYRELMITAKILAQGFYGWRDGSRVNLGFINGETARLAPGLNAGSAAVAQLFAALYPPSRWAEELFSPQGFLALYQQLLGDPWIRAAQVPSAWTPNLQQPPLTLPFTPGQLWSLTGGPHITWQTGTPRGAIDFAPITGEPACAVSAAWATAAAPGLVVRSARGVVALDLDGDGDEGTGWVLIYLHMAEEGRAPEGVWLEQDAPVGHPSCEGGSASGTHLHLTRKFNGEWLGVGNPLPLVLSGWRAYAGEGRYTGFLQKGEEIVNASPNGMRGSTIQRDD